MQPHKNLTKLALLSMATLLMSHLAISPVLPRLYSYYQSMNPSIGLATVESLATMPAMMITIFVLLSNLVIRWIGKKRTVLLGIGLIIVFGNLPSFVTDFRWVFLSRLLLGAGIGLFNSLSVSLMSDFYAGDERASMIGMRTAFLNIGKAVTTFVSGYLLMFGERYIFLSYLLAIPVFGLVAAFVPDVDSTASVKGSIQFRPVTLFMTGLTFIVGLCYMGLTIKIPAVIVTVNGLDVSVSRNIMTVLALSGTVAGLVFGPLLKRLGNATLAVMLAFMAVGSVLFLVTTQQVLWYVAAVLIGVSFVGTMSFVFYYLSKVLEKETVTFATSLVLVGGNIGVILTPLIMTKLPESLGWSVTSTPFYLISVMMTLVTTIAFVTVKEG